MLFTSVQHTYRFTFPATMDPATTTPAAFDKETDDQQGDNNVPNGQRAPKKAGLTKPTLSGTTPISGETTKAKRKASANEEVQLASSSC